jgi:hypothetical protein
MVWSMSGVMASKPISLPAIGTEAEMLRSVLISKFTRSGWPKGI